MEAQRSFTADASHQLRTPLTALRLNLDNLRDRLESRDEKAAVDKALAEAARLTRLVNSLLALARAQSARRRPEAMDVGTVVARRLEAWSAACEEADVELVSSPPVVAGAEHQPVLAWKTPGHLEQVLDNLLANALQSSPPGTTVTVMLRASDGQVILDVADQGPGLTNEELERVFDRFWSNTPGGSGLGLPIVRQLVEHDTGNVQLLTRPAAVPTNEPGQAKGLTVRITLPAWRKPRSG
ncbi:cell wall metabolism sensor histidine kinase WalK [Arthrobacter sp. ISL-30]|uniref:sensor histidine kinase n=1 Tax=Arthrobacter sp. ISL-30 TaxID=2819109 RepID=UPI001BEA4861|nr:HAMP domain-containing sensor histidine kinase [Arthrobacter sp. ISL-30]MBT2512994.1 HAMP domain-containing histidine kinase [Arthrobacter sp. ISL-30]